jgi:hypothetical protein
MSQRADYYRFKKLKQKKTLKQKIITIQQKQIQISKTLIFHFSLKISQKLLHLSILRNRILNHSKFPLNPRLSSKPLLRNVTNFYLFFPIGTC